MHPSAKRVFWIGMFVVWFDFTWDNIPLLPNIVGYAMLAWALAQLAAYSHWFSWARICAVGLTGVEAIRLLAGDLADLSSVSKLDPWLQISARLPAVPLLLGAGLYWFVSSGVIDCLRRLGDNRTAGHLRLVRAASLSLSLVNTGAVLWLPHAPRPTINIASLDWTAGSLALIVLLFMLLIGVGEIVLWSLALRRLPGPLHPVFPLPIADPRTVKRVTWGLLALGLIGLASIPLGRAPQAPVLLRLPGGSGVSALGSRATWSPDGTRLAVGGTVEPTRAYDPVSGKVLFEIPRAGEYYIHDLAWSPDGSRLLSAGTSVFINDGQTGAEIACITACSDQAGAYVWAESADWSPDGATLAVAANDLLFFDTRSLTYTLRIEDANAVMAAYSPDGTLLATASEQQWVRVRTSDGQLLHQFSIAEGTQVRAIAWSPDGKLLAVAADFNVVEIWDVSRAERVQAFVITSELERRLGMRPHHNPRDITNAVAWSPDGRFLAAGSTDASAGVWELASGEQVLRLNGQTDYIGDIEFSPDGRRIATASHDATVWIWDTSSIYE